MGLILLCLLAIPFLDRSPNEPDSKASAFNLRQRGLAFGAMGLFLVVLVAGLVQNFLSEAG